MTDPRDGGPARPVEVAAALVAALRGLSFPLPTASAAEARRVTEELAALLDGVAGRATATGPPRVAVAGPGGTGKSSVVNAIVGAEVVEVGSIRPTTTRAVPVAHPDDTAPAGLGEVTVVAADTLRGLVVIDLPPLGHPAGAIRGADLAVFVVSALRYADEATAAALRRVMAAGIPLVHVLNRAPPGTDGALVAADHARRLAELGLLDRPDPDRVVLVAEDPEGTVPAEVGRTLRAAIAPVTDPSRRRRWGEEAAVAAGRAVRAAWPGLRNALADQDDAHAGLHAAVAVAYRGASARFAAEIAGGAHAGLAAAEPPGGVAALARAVTRHAGVAAQEAAAAWQEDGVGEALLAGGGEGLWRHGPDVTAGAEADLLAWATGLDRLPDDTGRRLAVRHRRKLGRFVWESVLDPGPPRPAPVRRVGDAVAAATVAAAAGRLGDVVTARLDTDAGRFLDLLGPPPGGVAATAAIDRLLDGPGS